MGLKGNITEIHLNKNVCVWGGGRLNETSARKRQVDSTEDA